jgi:DNA-binding response OmpR family regulator
MANVLIVESYPPLGLLYCEEFEDEGHRVFLATSGREAEDIASQEPIDVVVIDEHLPDVKAEALIQRLKALLPQMQGPVCSVNELSEKSYGILCQDSYIKTSDVTPLKTAVQRVLSSKKFENLHNGPYRC